MPKVKNTDALNKPKLIKCVRRGRCVKLPASLRKLPVEHFALWGDESFRLEFKHTPPPPRPQPPQPSEGSEQQGRADSHSITFHVPTSDSEGTPPPQSPPSKGKRRVRHPRVKEEPEEDFPIVVVEVREPTPDLEYPSSRSVSPDPPMHAPIPQSRRYAQSISPPSSPPLTPPDSPPQRPWSSPSEAMQYLRVPHIDIAPRSRWPERTRSDPLVDCPPPTPQFERAGRDTLFAAVSRGELPRPKVKEEKLPRVAFGEDIRIADVDVDPSQPYSQREMGKRDTRFDPYRRPRAVLPPLSQFLAECLRAQDEALPSWYKKLKGIPESSHRHTSQPAYYSD